MHETRRRHRPPARPLPPVAPDPAADAPVVLSLQLRPGRPITVTLAGELDAFSAPAVARHLDAAAVGSAGALVVDLADVRFIDAAGLHVLLDAATRLQAEERPLRLRHPSRSVRRLLQVLDLETSFDVLPRERR